MTRFAALALLAAIFLCLCSCTQEQIDRAEQISNAADLRLAQAKSAEVAAEQALAEAKTLVEQFHSAGAQSAMVKAESALDQIKSAVAIAETTADATHKALQGAKDAQAAGGSSIAVVGAAASGALPGILAAVLAAVKWLQTLRSYRQTVTGLDAAKEALGQDWDTKVAPALDAAHDQKTRQLVATIQAKTA